MKLCKENNTYYCVTTFQEKDIPKSAGFKWNSGRWETKSLENASQLFEYAEEDLKAELEAQAVAFQAQELARKEEETRNRERARATRTDFTVPAGSGLSFLPYQLVGIEQAVQRNNLLIADEMGLGKTAQVIGTLNAVPEIQSVLIVATASLAKNWKREIEKFGTRDDLTIGFATTKTIEQTNIVITTYDVFSRKNAISPQIKEKMYDLLVLDECHYIKNKDSSRTKEILGYFNKGKSVPGIKAKRKLFLTGTPMLNRPVEIWTVAHALAPKSFPNFMDFAQNFCNAHQTRFGWDFSGASNLNELNDLLTGTIMVRRKKADVLTELPSKIRQVIELPVNSSEERKALQNEKDVKKRHAGLNAVNAKIKAQIEALEAKKDSTSSEDYARQIEDLKSALMPVPFNEIAEARHNTAIAKLPQTISVIQDVLDEDPEKKIIVFAHHKDVIQGLADGLDDYGTVQITGETAPGARLDIVDQFQTDDTTRVFIGSIHACAEGLTLTRASHVIFVELDWTPAKMSQAEDRAHRIGQKDTVLVQHLLLEDSFDANMAHSLAKKQLVIDQAIQ